MKRKLVKQGAATLMISIPSKWAKANNLDKGDEINIEESDKNLIISPSALSKPEKPFSINITGLHPLVNRALIALYIKGADEIEVTFTNPSEIKDFQKYTINELLGFEIIKHTHKSLLIKDVTGMEKQEIDEIIKRIFFILDSMAEELAISIEKKQSTSPVIESDTSVNRLTNFSLRILNKKGYPKQKLTSQMYGIALLLEEIGDCYKKIAVEAEKSKITSTQLKVIQESRELLKNFKEIIFSFNREQLVSTAKKYDSIKKFIAGKNMIDAYLYELINSIIKINNYLLVFSLTNE